MASASVPFFVTLESTWVCVGVLCSVLILLIVYGAVVVCRAVGSEVHADTVRLMEQMIALDQLANQYNNNQQTSDLQTGDGKDNSGGDLDEDSGKSFRKQRKFILEGDDDSVLSGAESSEDYSDEESPSRRGTPSSRESSARIRKVGEGGRTASAIAKAYVRPPSAGSILKDRRRQTRNISKKNMMDLTRQSKVHPSNFELEDYNEPTNVPNDIPLPAYASVAPKAWSGGGDLQVTSEVDTDTRDLTSEDIPVENPKDVANDTISGDESENSQGNLEESRVAFDNLVAMRSGVDSEMASRMSESTQHEYESSSTFATGTAKKYKRKISRPDSGYHK